MPTPKNPIRLELTMDNAFSFFGRNVVIYLSSEWGHDSGRVLAAGQLSGLSTNADGTFHLHFAGGFSFLAPRYPRQPMQSFAIRDIP